MRTNVWGRAWYLYIFRNNNQLREWVFSKWIRKQNWYELQPERPKCELYNKQQSESHRHGGLPHCRSEYIWLHLHFISYIWNACMLETTIFANNNFLWKLKLSGILSININLFSGKNENKVLTTYFIRHRIFRLTETSLKWKRKWEKINVYNLQDRYSIKSWFIVIQNDSLWNWKHCEIFYTADCVMLTQFGFFLSNLIVFFM